MKIGALVPIRLASERLPSKALKDICGRPVVYHLLDRVAACSYIGDPRHVVVCTTTAASDDPLVEAVERYGCSVFRGSVDDIIVRFADAMAAHGFDAVVQADGDDPLSSTEYMNATMRQLLGDSSIDIVTVNGLPLGTATKSFSAAAMRKVLSAYQAGRNDTGFIYYFTKTDICRHIAIDVENALHRHDTARLTLDYEVDLKLFRDIFAELYEPGKIFGLAEVVALLNSRPDLVASNLSVNDEYWSRTAEKAKLQYRDAAGNSRSIKI